MAGAHTASFGVVQIRSATLSLGVVLFEPHVVARPTSLLIFIWHGSMDFGSYFGGSGALTGVFMKASQDGIIFEARHSLECRIILKFIPIYTI